MSAKIKAESRVSTLRYMRDRCIAEDRQPTSEERSILAEIADELDEIGQSALIPEWFNQSQRPPIKPNLGDGKTPKGPFRNLGEQLVSIVRASIPGGEIDRRLPGFRAAATGASEGVPSDGGFLLQENFSNDLLRRSYELAPLASRSNRKSIGSNAHSIKLPAIDETSRVTGARLGGVQTFWVGEGDTPAPTKPKFRQIELSLKKLMGLCYVTDELLSDVSLLESIVRDAFSEEIAFSLDDGILRGTGAGQLLGVLNSPCLVTVAKEAGQGSDTVVVENLINMWSRMPAKNRKNAIWCINQDIEPQLFSLGLVLGTAGFPVFMPAGGISESPYGSLFGRPLVPVEQASTLGDAGDIILGDFSEYLLIDKGGLDFQGSIHVRFIYDEMVFRTVYRCDGQPIPNAAMTPFKGSNSQSPFITLEERA